MQHQRQAFKKKEEKRASNLRRIEEKTGKSRIVDIKKETEKEISSKIFVK